MLTTISRILSTRAKPGPTYHQIPSSPSKVEKKRNDLPLGVLIINCQSIKTPGKHAELANIIESTQTI
jgi:hypothetical protein